MEVSVVIGIVTAVLQLIAIGFLIWDIYETRRTTFAMEATLKVVQEQLQESRKANRELREAMIVSQMEIEWDSFEMNESISLAMSLEEDSSDCLQRWQEWGGSRLLSYQSLEIPRFYEILNKLVALGTISEEKAITHFGEDSEEYWNIFEPLIEEFRKRGGRYRKLAFYGFEDFINRVKKSDLLNSR